MISSIVRYGAVCAFVLATGCGASTGSDPNSGSNSNTGKAINRIKTVVSRFDTAKIEQAINAIVAKVGSSQDPATRPCASFIKNESTYWSTVMIGSNRAAAEIGCPPTFLYTTCSSGAECVSTQIANLNAMSTVGTKSATLAPFEATPEMLAAINSAVDNGTSIITIDTDVVDSKRTFYMGTDDASAGEATALKLASAVSNKQKAIVVGTTSTQWVNGYARTMGAQNALAKSGFTMVDDSPYRVRFNDAKDLDAIKQIIIDHPDLNAMVCVFSDAYVCGQAVDELASGKGPNGAVIEPIKSKIWIAGFDFDSRTLSYLNKSIIYSTTVQKQYYMGYFSAYTAYAVSVLGKDATVGILGDMLKGTNNDIIDLGVDILTSADLPDYMAYLDSIGIQGSN